MVNEPTSPGQVPQGSFDAARLYVWVKGLESKVNNLLRQIDIIKNDFIKKNTELRKEVKAMNDDLLEARREQAAMVQKVDMIIRELKQTAGMEEVAVLKKYVDLWNPLHFVTQRDVERVVDEAISRKTKSR